MAPLLCIALLFPFLLVYASARVYFRGEQQEQRARMAATRTREPM